MLKQLRQPDTLLIPIINSTKIQANKGYKVTPLCITQEVEEGTLYINTLTNEIVLSDIELTEHNQAIKILLAKHQFLVQRR